MLKLNQLVNTFGQHLYLDISPQVQVEAEQHIKKYTHDVARRNAYLNYLCLHTFLAWLCQEPDLQAQKPQLFPHEQALASIWSVVNGTALQIGTTRLVLIPSETNRTEELCVPWEWVDIPSWAADYYLAVQMNVEDDECWMCVWGFASYEKLQLGQKDTLRRTYSLPCEDLTASLNVMWIAREVCPVSKPEIAPLPALSSHRVEQLLAQLGESTAYSPRLEIPFSEWGAILEREQWRQALYERTEQVKPPQPLVNLRQWLQKASDAVEETWQTVESLLNPGEFSPVRGQAGTQIRSSLDTITPVLNLLQTNPSEQIRRQAAGVLGEIGAGYPDVVQSLVELLHSTQDEETRWQAALSLGKVDPQHPLGGVRRARIIDLGMRLDHCTIALIVSIIPRIDARIGIFLRLRPVGNLDKLPGRLKLSVLSESGENKLEAEARSDSQGQGKDSSLELRFSPPPGTHFQVKIALGDATVIEDFIA